jgi:hypothetical protein
MQVNLKLVAKSVALFTVCCGAVTVLIVRAYVMRVLSPRGLGVVLLLYWIAIMVGLYLIGKRVRSESGR